MDCRIVEILPLVLSLLALASCGNTERQTVSVAGYTLIDNMEDGTLRQPGRIAWPPPEGQPGLWSSSTDCTQWNRILPVPYFAKDSQWSYDDVPQAYSTMPGDTSRKAVHLRTLPGLPLQAVWGANVGFDFAESTASDGATSPSPGTAIDAGATAIGGQSCVQGSSRDFDGIPVSLSKDFSGVTFWAMAWAGGRQAIRVQLNDRSTDPRGNTCSSARETDDGKCYNAYGKDFALTSTFTQYALDFSELKQAPGWGYQVAGGPDLDHVYSMNFLVPLPGCTKDEEANCAGVSPPVAFDVWIDDIYFVNQP
jgi:hypothetical protein